MHIEDFRATSPSRAVSLPPDRASLDASSNLLNVCGLVCPNLFSHTDRFPILSTLDLKKVDSATKYPSILTYHVIGDRGRLKDEIQIGFSDIDSLILTEKINGANSRIVLFPDGSFLIGSRDEFLSARGDLVCNPNFHIVETLSPIAERCVGKTEGVTVLFGEVFGPKNLPGSKEYTGNGLIGFRLFDVMVHNVQEFCNLVSDLPCGAISGWRDRGGQHFLGEDELQAVSNTLGIPLTPRITTAKSLPASVLDTYAWLKSLFPSGSLARLDCNAQGNPEGVVVRTRDRTRIAKLRFEEYEKTLRV